MADKLHSVCENWKFHLFQRDTIYSFKMENGKSVGAKKRKNFNTRIILQLSTSNMPLPKLADFL